MPFPEAVALLNWVVLLGFLLGLFGWVLRSALRSRPGNREERFFRGTDPQGREIGFATLTATLLISWVFAKSVQNAADLGMAFGMPGGVAYATYWLSFMVAGVVIYKLRGAGFRSLHDFLRSRFGATAVWLFSLVLIFRIWNEIWSNTMVVAQFFGETGSPSFFLAAWTVTLLVLAYSLVSGFRGSILTDVLQMGLAAVLLVVILGVLLPRAEPAELVRSGSWTLVGGVDLILVAFVQCFSYPFHDPVMTDRGFLTNRPTMLRSFMAAGALGVLFIALFSLLGVFNHVQGIGGNSTMSSAAVLGLPALLFVNVMMLTSASSTLDSAFSSSGKLVGVDLLPRFRGSRVRGARFAMVVLALLGGAMVHAGPAILSATTVSGTMVIGLTPVFVLWKWRRPGRASFLSSVGLGLLLGIGLAAGWIPGRIGEGSYGNLLFVNVVGVIACFAVFVAFAWVRPGPRGYGVTTDHSRASPRPRARLRGSPTRSVFESARGGTFASARGFGG